MSACHDLLEEGLAIRRRGRQYIVAVVMVVRPRKHAPRAPHSWRKQVVPRKSDRQADSCRFASAAAAGRSGGANGCIVYIVLVLFVVLFGAGEVGPGLDVSLAATWWALPFDVTNSTQQLASPSEDGWVGRWP